jgi:hypothetical protein
VAQFCPKQLLKGSKQKPIFLSRTSASLSTFGNFFRFPDFQWNKGNSVGKQQIWAHYFEFKKGNRAGGQ